VYQYNQASLKNDDYPGRSGAGCCGLITPSNLTSASKHHLQRRLQAYQVLWMFVVLRLVTAVNVILVESDN